jgi:hypothetical protein
MAGAAFVNEGEMVFAASVRSDTQARSVPTAR